MGMVGMATRSRRWSAAEARRPPRAGPSVRASTAFDRVDPVDLVVLARPALAGAALWRSGRTKVEHEQREDADERHGSEVARRAIKGPFTLDDKIGVFVTSTKAVVVRSLLAVLALLFAVPGMVLLLGAVTWRGRAFGLWSLLMAWLCVSMMGAAIGRRPRQWRWAAGLAVIEAALVAWSVPDGGTANARVRNCFIAPASFPRWHPLNWISEADWAALGLRVLPWIDDYARREGWDHVRRLANEVFLRAACDTDVRRLGSCLHVALNDVIGARPAGAHYFAVFPRQYSDKAGQKYPVVVFLHGWLGNMSAYPLLLRGLADKTGAVVLIPSCGMGTWIYPDAPVLVSRVLADAAGRFPLDSEHVVLGGISNGGRGVYQTMAVLPNQFVGAFFITAMLDPAYYGPDPSGGDHRAERSNAWCDGDAVPPIGMLDDPALAGLWMQKSILVISGNRDVRVPNDYTEARVRLMRKAGLNVQWSVYEGDDHWLLFEEPERAINQIIHWMANDVMPCDKNRDRPK